MENGDRNLNQWVDERIARLDVPPTWRPDAERGLAGVRRKDRTIRRRRWSLSVAGLAALASALFTIPGCQAATCKVRSDSLAERLWNSVFVPAPTPPKPDPQKQGRSQPQPMTQAFVPPPAEVPGPGALRPRQVVPHSKGPVLELVKNFKESGSPTASVTCEIYADYECPACARLYLEVVPQLVADYVATGQVKLVHRDFPLSFHAYSRLAARYANAAGMLGRYEAAVTQLFRTQSSWGLSGDIDAQLAQALPAEIMAKVRELVQNDPHLDDSTQADVEQGRADQLTRTPSVAVVVNGKRRLVGTGDYAVIKAILDDSLGK
jgi:protein-disulfide isomerase